MVHDLTFSLLLKRIYLEIDTDANHLLLVKSKRTSGMYLFDAAIPHSMRDTGNLGEGIPDQSTNGKVIVCRT